MSLVSFKEIVMNFYDLGISWLFERKFSGIFNFYSNIFFEEIISIESLKLM